MKFKQFINEGLFGHFQTRNSHGKFPVYLNPSVAEIESLGSHDSQIRGMSIRDDIYVWSYWNGMHDDIAKLLGSNSDISFYLEIDSKNPLKITLAYSEFSGTSSRNGLGSIGNLNKLLTFPAMQELKPYITIGKPYQDPMKPNSYKKNIHDIKVPDDYDAWLKKMKEKWMSKNPDFWKKPEENDEI